MRDGSADVSRRGFLRAAAGGAAGSAAVGTAAAQESGGGNSSGGGGGSSLPPDFGGYLSDANNYDGSVVDATGQDEVTVDVGAGAGLAFGPAAVHVDNGATVVWEWTGEGGAHNVVSDGGEPLDSGPTVGEAGATYEYTFEEDGIYKYFCDPHEGSGMLGAVVVGTDYPTVQPAGPSKPQVPGPAKSLGVAATAVMLATLGFAWMFIKYGGDYGEVEK